MELNIHEIKLSGNTEFSQKFNEVSDLYAEYLKSESQKDWDKYFKAKLRLEQGY